MRPLLSCSMSLIAGDDDDVEALRLGATRDGSDHVVRLEAG